ncbi:MAG TPA: hypothetical protein VMF13_14520 [Luteitalea sp.]|nr:hypothetical protein [Luteitalea sp.]
MRRFLKRCIVAAVLGLLVLLTPVAYVEFACDGTPVEQRYVPRIADPAFRRLEANSYLTYPEWHIVFAYDGLAKVLETGDEHAFDYATSVTGFWRSTCSLMRVASAHGGADSDTRMMIHTIGVSFTAEMAAKAVYEESIGRVAAWWRGTNKTAQDRAVSATAVDYAAFLRQTPWYQYPFMREVGKLWAVPAGLSLRGWERRVGIGLEWTAKAGYARVIGGAAAASAPAALVIRSLVTGLDRERLSSMADVKVVEVRPGGVVEIETPRYARFTQLLAEIARLGGTVSEIAGNDDILVTLAVPRGAQPRVPGTVILRIARDGYDGDRLLLDVPVSELANLLRAIPPGDPGVEHVFDY